MKVLLVDDHRLLARALGSLIESRFPACTVEHAASLGTARLGLKLPAVA